MRCEGELKLIDFKQLRPTKGITYCRDHLRRKWKSGEFPKPIAISLSRIAWIESEIDQWLEEKTAARDAVPLATPPARPETKPPAGARWPRGVPDCTRE
jgi:prophage regulatory protein